VVDSQKLIQDNEITTNNLQIKRHFHTSIFLYENIR